MWVLDVRKDKSISQESVIWHSRFINYAWWSREHCSLCKTHHATLIVEFEARSVLWVVAVEVDDGQMGGAEQRRWDLGTGKLPNKSRTVLGTGPDLKEVVVVLRGEVLELNMGS